MPRKAPVIEIAEMPGDKFPSLAAAQEAARISLAADLAETMRRLLSEGLLINIDGRIIPNPERTGGQ